MICRTECSSVHPAAALRQARASQEQPDTRLEESDVIANAERPRRAWYDKREGLRIAQRTVNDTAIFAILVA